MDYGRPELADRLASEYVLGTLRGPARRRFESLLGGHPALRGAVAQWQARLATLDEGVVPVEPSPQAWARLESRLFPGALAPAPTAWWRRAGPWRLLSGLSTAALVAVLVVGQPAPDVAPPVVVVLAANPQVDKAVQARFVASVSADGRALVLRPIDLPQLDARQALELWAVPPEGAPRSLGLVTRDGATTLLRAQLLRDTAAFAVSVEPPQGSPTGAPTGPIISVGSLKS